MHCQGSLNSVSGGYIYDRKIVEGLRHNGWTVHVHEIPPKHALFTGLFPDDFPPLTAAFSDETLSRALKSSASASSAVASSLFGDIPRGALLVIDSMAILELWNEFGSRKDAYCIVPLIHYPFSQEVDTTPFLRSLCLAQEAEAFKHAHSFIAASAVSRDLLAKIYGVNSERITIVRPGVCHQTFHAFTADSVPASAASGSGLSKLPTLSSPIEAKEKGKVRLISVANAIPRKGFSFLLECVHAAAKRHTDRTYVDWSLSLIGALFSCLMWSQPSLTQEILKSTQNMRPSCGRCARTAN